MIRAFLTALRTLTILPVPGRDAVPLTAALYHFPAVGALIGGLVTLAAWLLGGLAGWPAGAGAAGVLAAAGLTRALHLDGLGDTADAWLGASTARRRLEIMKDPHLGVFGVTAIGLVLLLKAAALARLSEHGAWAWIPVPFILARLVQVWLAVTLPYARAEGGTAAAFVKQARAKHLVVAAGAGAGLCALLAGVAGAGLALVACLVGGLLTGRLRRSFGGATGDLLGCASELVECAFLFGLAAALPAAAAG